MSRHRKPDTKQRGLFEPRNVLRTYLKRMVIPSFTYLNGRGREVRVVGSVRMKALLHVIESHCGYKPGEEDPGCFLKLQTIAQEMGCKPRKEGRTIEDVDTATATRAIAECEHAGLLKVERSFYKDKASVYRIEWCKVKQIILDNPATEHLINSTDPIRSEPKAAAEEMLPVDEIEATTTHCNEETTHGKLQLTHGNLQFTHCNLQLTHGKLQSQNDAHTTSSRTRGFNHALNHEDNHVKNHEPNEFAGYAGWPFEISRQHLDDYRIVQSLWEHSLRKGYGAVTVADRISFFALVFCAKQPQVRNPGGYLTVTLNKIAAGQTNWPEDKHAFRWAVRAVELLDHGRVGR